MIKLRNIKKSYSTEYTRIEVLKGVDLDINDGEMVAIMGESGSGKTTLLNILGLLDTFDSGSYIFDNLRMSNLSIYQKAHYRNTILGFVFQNANLISYKNILENVSLPLYYQNINQRVREKHAKEILEYFGLADWAKHFPNELSGGQRQRVALARAIITKPRIILADEPTGQLDSSTANEVINLFKAINREEKTAIVVVTHSQIVAEEMNRIVRIIDGRI